MINLIESSSFTYPKDNNKINLDSILPVKKFGNGYLFAVADGVGSYLGAEDASKIAIDVIDKLKTNNEIYNFESLFHEIRKKIIFFGENSINYRNAATTLTLCYINDKGIKIAHVGDCRLYIKQGVKLNQITKDQTHYQNLIDEKIYTKLQLSKQKSVKHILTSAIAKNVIMAINEIFIPISELKNNDLSIYIMSDGAYHFWEKRPRFSNNTMNSIPKFMASFFRRIEKQKPIDDYSIVGARFLIDDSISGKNI